MPKRIMGADACRGLYRKRPRGRGGSARIVRASGRWTRWM